MPRIPTTRIAIAAAVAGAITMSVLPFAATRVGAQELSPAPSGAGARTRTPNVVLIVTDDQRYDELAHMRAVHRALIDRGMRLRRGFVVNPLCCPSRASTLTGSYSHTHGIYLNGDGLAGGGFPDFRDASTLPVWLRKAGYATALVGKYLNNYRPASYVPPGWTSWVGLVGQNSAYYDYSLSVNGRIEHHGSRSSDYSTDVLARHAEGFIRGVRAGRSLFLYFAPPAPHGPYIPPPRYLTASTSSRPRYPSFNEADRTDKPHWVARRQRLSPRAVANVQAYWSARARMLMALDDAVKRIVDALAETGRLHDTLIVYTSDNGMSMGEHTLQYKMNAYEESIRVPLIVRWDGHVPAGSTSWHLATNIDLAPTIAAVAGARLPSWVEGRSLLPILQDGKPVRASFLVENQHSLNPEAPPTYCAIRTPRWKLVRYASSVVELYDLKSDPWELENVARRPALAARRAALTEQLRTLCEPLPPGMAGF